MSKGVSKADGSRRAFVLDSTSPGAAARGFDAFRHRWEKQVGDDLPLPTYSPATIDNWQVKGRVVRVRDVTVADIHAVSPARSGPSPGGDHDHVAMYMPRRGGWAVGGTPGLGGHTVSAGQILLRHFGRPVPFERAPNTTAKVLFLPSAVFKPLLGNRIIKGSADAAEVRLLLGHMHMVHVTIGDLSPAGVHAAHSALIELAKAVATGRFDDVEPQLAPALVQAAKELVDSRLADSELSPTVLAGELNVSLRTLQRAFGAVGESVTAHIRQRRLEEARLALGSPHGRPSVSAVAARWHFSDSSHFIRAFKKKYGQTPMEYARMQTGQK